MCDSTKLDNIKAIHIKEFAKFNKDRELKMKSQNGHILINGGKKMSRRQDIVILQLQQDRDRIEKENNQLMEDLKNYDKDVSRCVLDKYTIENREGIYRFVDSKGNIVNGCEIKSLIEKSIENNSSIENFIEIENFNTVYDKVSNYNRCYIKILENDKKIEVIDKDIKSRENN